MGTGATFVFGEEEKMKTSFLKETRLNFAILFQKERDQKSLFFACVDCARTLNQVGFTWHAEKMPNQLSFMDPLTEENWLEYYKFVSANVSIGKRLTQQLDRINNETRGYTIAKLLTYPTLFCGAGAYTRSHLLDLVYHFAGYEPWRIAGRLALKGDNILMLLIGFWNITFKDLGELEPFNELDIMVHEADLLKNVLLHYIRAYKKPGRHKN